MEAEEDLRAHGMEDVAFQQYLAEALALALTAEYGQKEPVSNQGRGRAPESGADIQETRKAKAEVGDLGF